MGELLRLVGQIFLFCLLVIACGAVLARTARAAFSGGSSSGRKPAGGSRGRALRSPAPRAIAAGGTAGRSAIRAITHPGNSAIRAQARADIRRMREETRLADWIEDRRHGRANGTTGTGGTTTATRPTIRQRLRLVPFTPSPSSPDSGGSTNGVGGRHCAMCPQPLPDDYVGAVCPACRDAQRKPAQPAAGNGSPPASPSPPPGSAQPEPNGGTTVPGASTAAAQKMIEGINEIQAHAAAGGIHAKREALAAIREGAVRFASMVQGLSRQLAEPGMNYGPEITEPLAKAGQHFNAGAMTVGEADNAIETLINMTVGDLAHSPRQAPHHRELSENGSR